MFHTLMGQIIEIIYYSNQAKMVQYYLNPILQFVLDSTYNIISLVDVSIVISLGILYRIIFQIHFAGFEHSLKDVISIQYTCLAKLLWNLPKHQKVFLSNG